MLLLQRCFVLPPFQPTWREVFWYDNLVIRRQLYGHRPFISAMTGR